MCATVKTNDSRLYDDCLQDDEGPHSQHVCITYFVLLCSLPCAECVIVILNVSVTFRFPWDVKWWQK